MSLDVYALASARSRAVVERFCERWVRDLEPSADEYEFPQYAERPEVVYGSPREVVDRLLAEPGESYALYWQGADGGAMLFFTADGGLVAGRTVPDEEARRALGELAETVGARAGYATFDQPPPETAAEFVARARAADMHL